MSDSEEDLELDVDSVVQQATEFSLIDQQINNLTQRKKELRDRLYGLVDLEGTPDDRGNLLFALPDICGDIQALQLQRRVSRPLDGDVAEEILKSIEVEDHTLWDDCIELVAVLDDQKIMAAHYDGLLTEDQVDAMFPEVESFAFSPIRVAKKRSKRG